MNADVNTNRTNSDFPVYPEFRFVFVPIVSQLSASLFSSLRFLRFHVQAFKYHLLQYPTLSIPGS